MMEKVMEVTVMMMMPMAMAKMPMAMANVMAGRR